MKEFWNSVRALFEQRWWQGFGGIAQLIAAILTIISVEHARKMLNLAKKERRESVEPSWDIVRDDIETKIASPNEYYNLEGQITLLNSGFGPARNLEIDFESLNGNKPIEVRKDDNVIFPKEEVNIKFKWNVKKPPTGTLSLHCVTRLGHEMIRELEIETHFEVNTQNFGKWNLKWVSDNKGQENLLQRFHAGLKGMWSSNQERQDDEDILGEIKKYYRMEKWVNDNFEVQGDPRLRGSIVVNRREKETNSGGKVIVTTGLQIHKFVSMFGLIDVPPTAAELQGAIPEEEDRPIWSKRIKKWLEAGIIEEGRGFRDEV